jgi:hypothetical protein
MSPSINLSLPARFLLLSAAIAAMHGSPTHAADLDVNAFVRSKITSDLHRERISNILWDVNLLGTRPSNMVLADVNFKGSAVGNQWTFSRRAMQEPPKPVAVGEQVGENCEANLADSQEFEFSHLTSKSRSWGSADTITAEASLSVEYAVPAGPTVTGSVSLGYSKEWNRNETETVEDNTVHRRTITIPPKKYRTVQYVVTAQPLDMDYTLGYTLSGTANFHFVSTGADARISWDREGVAGKRMVRIGGDTGLQVCRATHTDGSIRPGTYIPGSCRYTKGGKVHFSRQFQVLYAERPDSAYWLPMARDLPLPATAPIVGSSGTSDLRLCRARDSDGNLVPGEWVNNKCNYVDKDKAESTEGFAVFMDKTSAGRRTVTRNLEEVLGIADRVMNTTGVFNEVNYGSGFFAASDSMDISEERCRQINAGISSRSATNSQASRSTKTVRLNRIAPRDQKAKRVLPRVQ